MAKRIQGRTPLQEQRTEAGVQKSRATNTRAPRTAASTPQTPIARPERSRPKVEPLVIKDGVTNEERVMPVGAYNLIRHEQMPINGGRKKQRYTVVSGDAGPEPKKD